MFGFDVLVDQQQKPHLLEVNFSPSLNTDSDLDLDVKSKVRHRRNMVVYMIQHVTGTEDDGPRPYAGQPHDGRKTEVVEG